MSHRAKPPKDVTNLAAWLKWQPQANQFVTAQDGKHFMAIGRNGKLLPSGPSVYVFDDRSQLVDWTNDEGDDPEFAQKWRFYSQTSLASRADAETWAVGHQPRE